MRINQLFGVQNVMHYLRVPGACRTRAEATSRYASVSPNDGTEDDRTTGGPHEARRCTRWEKFTILLFITSRLDG